MLFEWLRILERHSPFTIIAASLWTFLLLYFSVRMPLLLFCWDLRKKGGIRRKLFILWRVLPSSNSTYFSYPPEFGEILFNKIVQDININSVLYVKAEYLLWFLVLHAIPHSRSFFWSNLLDYWRKKGFLWWLIIWPWVTRDGNSYE